MEQIKGFTLIELLVVVTIMMLFSGLSIAYFNEFTNKQKLDGIARNVIDVLELAKKKADTGDSSLCAGVGITPRVDKYSVVVSSSTEYKLVPTCLTGVPTSIPYPTLKSPIVFATPTLAVQFSGLNIGASGAQCIKLQNSGDANKCTYINIQSTGLINLLSCTDTCPPP
ncbi:MAG: prepilin-type N-terminal cleavage/methylation domain-containing protein [Candidatus Roizmanbacteria bacterium]|nr:MAG: prepilin-type N-terminal cleavage/methylation domain-containing protein [Candidatus Roizmanbacteria bacterium]